MDFSVNNAVLAKGWKRFSVMHMDRKVASIREDGTCTIYSPSFMPYNLYLEPVEPDDLDTRLNNLNNFYYAFRSPFPSATVVFACSANRKHEMR